MTKTMTRLAAGAALAGLMAAPALAETRVIHAGHVLAEPGEGYLTRQTITVEDGKIVSVEAGYKRAPRGAELIDLKDAYVLPGLIDSHVHITGENGPNERITAFEETDVDAAFDGAGFAYVTLLSGFTTVQDVGASNNAIFGLRDAIAKGNVPGPRIRASGQAISVTGGHGDINGYSPEVMAMFTGKNICNGADDCRRAVRQQIKEGADVIKITATGGVLSNTRAGLEQQFTDDELAAIVETAHSMGRKVTAHAHGKGGIVAALKAGIDSIEHGTYTDEETVALFKEHGAVLVPTVLAGATVTGWVDEPWLPAPSREKAAIIGPMMIETLRRAREGGVTVAFGTDTGVSKHGDNAGEFDLMIEAGYTPEEAIRTATVVASEHVEMADMIGTITAGKHADIIAVTGDPLKDIGELHDIDFVMKGGTVYKQAQ